MVNRTYTVELDLLEISRISDALELWKKEIPNTFHKQFQTDERKEIDKIILKLVDSIPPAQHDPNCHICGLPGGH